MRAPATAESGGWISPGSRAQARDTPLQTPAPGARAREMLADTVALGKGKHLPGHENDPGAGKGSPAPQRASGARQKAQETVNFRVAAVAFGGRLWVEDIGEEAFATAQLQLFASIARALVHPQVPAGSPQVFQFDWPMHQNQQLDLGADEAQASLGGFLLRHLETHGCAELMSFGSATHQRLMGLSLPCAYRQLPSSESLLADPQAKRALWSTLRP